MQVYTNIKQLYSSLQDRVGFRRKDPKRTLQISQPFNFKKEPSTLPGLTESEIFALREKAAASRIAILPDYTPPSPSRSRCSSPGSPRSSLVITTTATSSDGEPDFFAPPIPPRSARRAASMMVVRGGSTVGGGAGAGAGGSTTSLPTGSGCSTPVDLDELFGPATVVSAVPGRGRAGWGRV